MRNVYSKAVFLSIAGMVFTAQTASATTSSSVLVYSNQLMRIATDLTTGKLPTALALISLGVACAMHFMGKEQQVVHILANVVIVLAVLTLAPSILSALGLYSATF